MKKIIIIIATISFISKMYGQCNSVVGVISGTPPCDNNPYVIALEDNFNNNELNLDYWITLNCHLIFTHLIIITLLVVRLIIWLIIC